MSPEQVFTVSDSVTLNLIEGLTVLSWDHDHLVMNGVQRAIWKDWL